MIYIIMHLEKCEIAPCLQMLIICICLIYICDYIVPMTYLCFT